MTVVAGYARTAFVKSNGQFASIPATELGARAIAAALEKAGVDPRDVQQAIGGQVLQGGAGQNPARQSAYGAGIPLTVPASTINVVCLSGMEAVVQAHRLISCGEIDVAVAFGQESMSLAPHAWVGSRAGKKFGSVMLVDTMEHDGLSDAFEGVSMGLSTDRYTAGTSIDRETQDAWAAASHQRLARAIAGDLFADEITAVEVPGRGGPTVVTTDDGVRAETTVDTLARLRPSFRPEGTITAGNASQISDGAAALVLVSERWAEEHGIAGIAELVSHAFVSGPDVSLLAQPSNAIRAALAQTDISPDALTAVEINEAFASVAVHSTGRLGVAESIVNANGGAIALGHPVGASGARIVGHLALRLSRAGAGSVGAAGICGGGGQGSAVVLRAL